MDPNNILIKHRRFLKGLEEQKVKEREDKGRGEVEREEKKKRFVEVAAVQRQKIKGLKREDQIQGEEADNEYVEELPKARLTE